MSGRRFLTAVAAVGVLVAGLTACTSSSGSADGGERTASGPGSSSPLKIGYILPQTGELAQDGRGKAQITAVKYAVKVINDAGGVNGRTLPAPSGVDETGDPAQARANVSQLLENKVDAIIGPADSQMTLAIIDAVVRSKVVECSGSDTDPALTRYPDDGFYFRTAPSAVLQAPVLANLVVTSGHTKVVVVARDGSSGAGDSGADGDSRAVQRATVSALESAGATVRATLTYDPQSTGVATVVDQIREAGPDAVVLLAPDGAAQLLAGLVGAGLGPAEIGVFGTERQREGQLPEQVRFGDPNVLDTMMGTAASSRVSRTFLENLAAFDGSLETEQGAAGVFDCAVTLALAAQQAGTSDPTEIKAHMIDVTKGGTTCVSFEACKTLLQDGVDINYDGVSGPLDFDAHGEPSRASIEIWQFADGRIHTVRTVTSPLR